MDFNSFDEILDFAIAREEEAYEFYNDLAARMDIPHMRAVFESFANEELGHKSKLLAIREGEIEPRVINEVVDLKISDYVVDIEPGPNMDYQQALIVAMKREKAAFKLYLDLAAKVTFEVLRSTFLMLAQEEAKHKLQFEIEYDEMMG